MMKEQRGAVIDQPQAPTRDEHVGVAGSAVHVRHVGIQPDDVRGELGREQVRIHSGIECQGARQKLETKVWADATPQDVLDLRVWLAASEALVQVDNGRAWDRQVEVQRNQSDQCFGDQRTRTLPRASKFDGERSIRVRVHHGGQRAALAQGYHVSGTRQARQLNLHVRILAACYVATVNRTDRLYALVEELRARAPRLMRANDLAQRFEVTTRTIERDLLALQEAGVPIWAQPGPGGGYSLNVDATLPPLNLTPAEAAAIATALAATRSMPFAAAGESALRKLTGVMAAAPRTSASKLVSHIRVAQGPSHAPAETVAEVIQQALLGSVAVKLRYRDTHGSETERMVEPAGVVGTRHGWYLAAWCRLRKGPRAFRLDRIVEACVTDQAITPRSLDSMLPDLPFELAEPALM
jgi:predicted DNA-binding transcriptional regulator YafY